MLLHHLTAASETAAVDDATVKMRFISKTVREG